MANRVALVLALASLLWIGLPKSSVAVPTPTITAGSAIVNVGDTFDILISISSPVEVDSWQFDLSFTPSLLKANSVTEGPFLSSSGAKLTLFTPGVINNVAGAISLVADSFSDLPPGPTGSGVIADINFTALAPGVSPLTLSNVFLNDLDSGFQTTNGQVTIRGAAVPEPMTVALLAMGLGAAVCNQWRRTRWRRG